MSALTTNRYTRHRDGLVTAHPVADSEHIFKGSLVCANTDGYAAAGKDSAGFKFLGVALEEADNSAGSDGDVTVKVLAHGVFSFAKSGTVVQADLGKSVYVVDDQTVALAATTTNDIACGKIEALDGASALWVRVAV
jgi:hypothetical protein